MGLDLAAFDSEFPWFFASLAFVMGAMIGSFLNVVIYRVPAGQSIVRPPSHCACGTPIPWRHNLPIVSWLVLRGRAACCGRPYSVRYAFIELLTGILFLTAWLRLPPVAAFGAMVLLALLIAATFIDLDHMIIPDGITIWGTLAAVLLSFALPGLHGFGEEPFFLLGSIRSGFASILGVFVGSGLILWIALLAEAVLRKEAMGFGDVKFMGLIGAFLGWPGAVFAVFGGAIVGTVWFFVAMLWQAATGRKGGAALRAETPEGEATAVGFGAHVPFGPMLAIAAAIYLLAARPWFDAYIDQLRALW